MVWTEILRYINAFQNRFSFVRLLFKALQWRLYYYYYSFLGLVRMRNEYWHQSCCVWTEDRGLFIVASS